MPTTKIKTDDAALGKKLSAGHKKVNDTDVVLCEIGAQFSVNRKQFQRLAGIPETSVSHLYTEEGSPVAEISMLLIKRELVCTGKFWRGEQQHISEINVRKAIVSDLRFKLEPNGAVFICKLKWKALGHEIEDGRHLFGQWCSAEVSFSDEQGQQAALNLNSAESTKNGGAGKDLPGMLTAAGVEILPDSPFWTSITPAQMSALMDYAQELIDSPDAEIETPTFLHAFLVNGELPSEPQSRAEES